MKTFAELLEDYNYEYPKKLIAQNPASPRDSAKLLIYDKTTKKTFFDTFINLPKHLPKNSVLVFNQTKVVPARLQVIKQTGGKAELLYISHNDDLIKVISDRKLKAGDQLRLGRGASSSFTITSQQNQFYLLKPCFPIGQIGAILKKYGQTPLPPYIKNSKLTETERREKYQAVFAKSGMSAAAPTASLHFTRRLINKLKKQGIATKFVTLHVGLGTFAPLREENISSGTLHEEYYEIDDATAKFLNKARSQGRPIISVGTTVTRTLESAAIDGKLLNLSGITKIFIQPSYNFRFITGIITNFHVPRSSLLMLVSAFVDREIILNLYKKAITKKFKLFSFGDGMLLK